VHGDFHDGWQHPGPRNVSRREGSDSVFDRAAGERADGIGNPTRIERGTIMLRKVSAVAGLVAASAAGSAPAVHAAPPQGRPVAITFALTANGRDVGCGAPLLGLGIGQARAKLVEARLYVHDFRLVDSAGKTTPVTLDTDEWQVAGVALVDFKDARGGNAPCSEKSPAKNVEVTGAAPPGEYVGLEFSLGVPTEGLVDGNIVALNHSSIETAPPPLDVAAMNWSWQAGRKFLMIDVAPEAPIIKSDGTKGRTYFVHLGSTGCTGNPATGAIVACAKPNRVRVRLDKFDARRERVTLDLGRLFEGSDLAVDKGGPIGCMSAPDDPDCPAILGRIGVDSAATVGSSAIFSASVKPSAVEAAGGIR
jgi:uncharacterized repeat protein (TIGR04052 family)